MYRKQEYKVLIFLFLLTLAVGVWGVVGAKDEGADQPRYTDGAVICSGEAVLVCDDKEWKAHGQSEYCKKPCGGEDDPKDVQLTCGHSRKECWYRSKAYSPGIELMQQDHWVRVCDDGEWVAKREEKHCDDD
jgi:hypothetical protein